MNAFFFFFNNALLCPQKVETKMKVYIYIFFLLLCVYVILKSDELPTSCHVGVFVIGMAGFQNLRAYCAGFSEMSSRLAASRV